jgi:hypothetical protein
MSYVFFFFEKTRLDDIGKQLIEKDEQCSKNEDLLRNITKQIEVIRASNSELQKENLDAQVHLFFFFFFFFKKQLLLFLEYFFFRQQC